MGKSLQNIVTSALELADKVKDLVHKMGDSDPWKPVLDTWVTKFEDDIINYLDPNKKTPLPTDIYISGNSEREECMEFYINWELKELSEMKLYKKPNQEYSAVSPWAEIEQKTFPLYNLICNAQEETRLILRFVKDSNFGESTLPYWLKDEDVHLPTDWETAFTQTSNIGNSVLRLEKLDLSEIHEDDQEHVFVHARWLRELHAIYKDYTGWVGQVEVETLPKSVKIAAEKLSKELQPAEKGVLAM